MAIQKKKANKKTAGTSSKKGARSSKKSPKVKLDSKAVVGVTIAIVMVCAAALFFTNFVIFRGNSGTEEVPKEFLEPAEVSNQESESKNPVESNKKKSSEKSEAKENADSKSGQKATSSTYELVPEDEVDPGKADAGGLSQISENKYNVPAAVNNAKICFVIDDGGLNLDNVKKYSVLPFPLTLAVLPGLKYSKECAASVVSSGKELILHQPMQAHDYSSGKTPDPGPGAILPAMEVDEVMAQVSNNLMEIGPGVKGVNNHEGSLITEDNEKMQAVISVVKNREIYFLDSRTTSSSAVPSVVKENGMTYVARFAPFLDNVVDREQMLARLLEGLEVANKNGYAVIIGHVDKSVGILPDLLSEIYPYLVDKGYTLTTPSSLVK